MGNLLYGDGRIEEEPVRFRNKSVDVTGVDDRRGRGPAVAMGGGVGIVGLIVYLLMNVLGGGQALDLSVPSDTQMADTGETTAQLQARCNTDGAIDRYNDCFLIKVYNEINAVWTEEVASYQRPRLAFFERGVQTGCGAASSEVGPFYCPGDREVFIDLGFLKQLQEQFGATGRYAQAYILAHEVGHHLQTLFGTESKVRRAQQRDPSRANQLSVALELQADCYAGVWGKLANDREYVTITQAELDEALNAAASVGDDRIQKKTQGRVNPESFTHGSARQRRDWYVKGYDSGSLDSCDTFQ